MHGRGDGDGAGENALTGGEECRGVGRAAATGEEASVFPRAFGVAGAVVQAASATATTTAASAASPARTAPDRRSTLILRPRNGAPSVGLPPWDDSGTLHVAASTGAGLLGVQVAVLPPVRADRAVLRQELVADFEPLSERCGTPRPGKPKKPQRMPGFLTGLLLGYLDSNQEQRYQKPPCCQLHHTPLLRTEARAREPTLAYARAGLQNDGVVQR